MSKNALLAALTEYLKYIKYTKPIQNWIIIHISCFYWERMFVEAVQGEQGEYICRGFYGDNRRRSQFRRWAVNRWISNSDWHLLATWMKEFHWTHTDLDTGNLLSNKAGWGEWVRLRLVILTFWNGCKIFLEGLNPDTNIVSLQTCLMFHSCCLRWTSVGPSNSWSKLDKINGKTKWCLTNNRNR